MGASMRCWTRERKKDRGNTLNWNVLTCACRGWSHTALYTEYVEVEHMRAHTYHRPQPRESNACLRLCHKLELAMRSKCMLLKALMAPRDSPVSPWLKAGSKTQ